MLTYIHVHLYYLSLCTDMHCWYQLKASSTSNVHVLSNGFLITIVASSLLKIYLVSAKGLVKTGIDFMLTFQQTLCFHSATIHRSINLNSAKWRVPPQFDAW